MNVASLEIAFELYTISGWDTGTKFGHPDSGMIAPNYDLGYLLRKFPPTIKNIDHGYEWRLFIKPALGGWVASYSNELFVRLYLRNELRQDESLYTWRKPFYADSPEDAAAKLTIELFKQGILTKEAGDAR